MPEARDGSPIAANQRLTALTGLIIYVLLAAIAVTVIDVSGLLTEHYVVGFLLLPPVVLKLGSTGYRFVRYYQGELDARKPVEYDAHVWRHMAWLRPVTGFRRCS